MKTVLHLIESLGRGGAEKRLLLDLRYLPRDRFVHHVCYLQAPHNLRKELNDMGVAVHFLGMTSPMKDFVRCFWRLTRLIKKLDVDLIHTQLFWADLLGRLAGAIEGVPVVSTVQSSVYANGAASLYSSKRKWIDRLTAKWGKVKFVAVSESVKGSIINALGISPSDAVVSHNYFDPSELESRPNADIGKLRQSLSLSDENRVIASVGKFNAAKGYEYLIRALPGIMEIYPSVRLMLIGDGPIRGSLEGLAAELCVGDQILFLGEKEDVWDLLSLADIFVLPSLSEGFSLALLEAMALGKPCVATAIGPNREVITHGQTGFLVPPGDSVSLSSALRELLEHRELAESLGRHGKAWVWARFIPLKSVSPVEQLYGELLGI